MTDRTSPERPPITPDLKVAALLEAYPQAEAVLIELAPAFKKLRNPVLRRRVAKIATLRQAASVGEVSLGELISKLRCATGQTEPWTADDAQPSAHDARPPWVDRAEQGETFDARPLIEGGGHPLAEVMAMLQRLEPGQQCLLITPFVPAPLIDKARALGFAAWTARQAPEMFVTHFVDGTDDR